MHVSEERRNLIILGNAVELATGAVMRVMGSDSSKELDGVPQTRQMVSDAVAARLASHIRLAMGVK